MNENGPKITFRNHPSKALSSLEDRKDLLRIFKFFENKGLKGLRNQEIIND